MSKEIFVPRQFIDDFAIVAEHFDLKELGQYEEAKKAAKSDMQNAITSFRLLAEELAPLDHMATGINQRIKTQITNQMEGRP